MYNVNNIKITTVLFVIVFLQACGEGSEGIIGTGFNVSGAVQKGPFILGSSILVNSLSPSGAPTNETIVTETRDNLGNFSFTLDEPKLLQLVATGYHFNELTGKLSNSTLTLRAIYDAGFNLNQNAYVNVLTHLIQARILALLKSGKKISDATTQAQKELINALHTVFPIDQELAAFTNLDLLNSDKNDSLGNAYLLALSATLYQMATNNSTSKNNIEAELSANLSSIADDLAEDGSITNTAILDSLERASRQLIPGEISSKLSQYVRNETNNTIDTPDINLVLDTDGDGVVNSLDDDADGDGILDAENKDFIIRPLDKQYAINSIKQLADDSFYAVGNIRNGGDELKEAVFIKLNSNAYIDYTNKISSDRKLALIDAIALNEKEFIIIGTSDKESNKLGRVISTLHISKINDKGEVLWERYIENTRNITNFHKLYQFGNTIYLKTVVVDFTKKFPSNHTPRILELVSDGTILWDYQLNKNLENFISVNSLSQSADGSLKLVGAIYESETFSSSEEANAAGYQTTSGHTASDGSFVYTGSRYKAFSAELNSVTSEFDHAVYDITIPNMGDANGLFLEDNTMLLAISKFEDDNLFSIDMDGNINWQSYAVKLGTVKHPPLLIEPNNLAIISNASVIPTVFLTLTDLEGYPAQNPTDLTYALRQHIDPNLLGNLKLLNVYQNKDKSFLILAEVQGSKGTAPILLKTNSQGQIYP